MNRVTCKTIAASLGVSASTVSRALRNDPRLKDETIEKVKHAAAEAGYQLDPRISKAYTQVLNRSHSSLQHIALIHNKPTNQQFRSGPAKAYWTAAVKVSNRLGFAIDMFTLQEVQGKGKRLSEILQHRGIEGLLVCAFYEPDIRSWNIDWDQFSAVAVGSSPQRPTMLKVDTDDYGHGYDLTKTLIKEGARKIGYISSPDQIAHEEHRSAAGYRSACDAFHAKAYPIHMVKNRNTDGSLQEKRQLSHWFGNGKMDAIVSAAPWVADYLHKTHDLPERRIGFPFRPPERFKQAQYVDYDPETIVSPALQLLKDQLFSQKKGVTYEEPTPSLHLRCPVVSRSHKDKQKTRI